MSSPPPDPTPSPADRLASLITEAKTAYLDLKQAAEAAVVRSEWATGTRYAEEPAHFEVRKIRRGRRLTQRPQVVAGTCQYGFDAAGRVVVERRFTELTGQAYETFLRHEEAGSARFHFGYGPNKPWINCAWIDLGPRGVEAIHSAYASGVRLEATYVYDDEGRFTTLTLCRQHPPRPEAREYRDLSYDAEGNVHRVIWRTETGECTVHYERPAEVDRLLAAQPRLLAGLEGAIVSALEAARFDEPIAAISFTILGAHHQHRLPPVVTVARRSTLERLRDQHGPSALATVWNPAEWPDEELPLMLADSLSNLCASASQDTWQNGLDAEVDHLLLRLAAALEVRALPIERAEGFAVVVLEVDGEEDLAKQVAGQVGRETREKLRLAGLL